MIDELAGNERPTCENGNCPRPLPQEPAIAYRTDDGERRAYECQCGAVTVTVVDGSD